MAYLLKTRYSCIRCWRDKMIVSLLRDLQYRSSIPTQRQVDSHCIWASILDSPNSNAQYTPSVCR